MRIATRVVMLCCLSIGLAPITFGQAVGLAAAGVPAANLTPIKGKGSGAAIS
jgi:hypothetical protein